MNKVILPILIGFLLPLLFSACKPGRTFTVSGTVTDDKNVPVANATIIGDWNKEFSTDSLGRFQVNVYGSPYKKKGKATIGLKKEGYKEQNATVREGTNNVIRLITCKSCGKTSPGKSPG